MPRLIYIVAILITILTGCVIDATKSEDPSPMSAAAEKVIVLGIAQDAGYPQAGCQKDCCRKHYAGWIPKQKVSCISIVDTISQSYWIIDATPDFKEQLLTLQLAYPKFKFKGIFLTHAHIGHYTGLMHLGREAMGANNIPVYAMPKMKSFLENNGPWSQLVNLKNIEIKELVDTSIINLNNRISVEAIAVPHRDEFSETVGFKINGPNQSVLFIPDIDKWDKWDRNIINEIKSVDHALLDGTFFKNGEIPGRDMSLIPHPFMEESIALFKQLEENERNKISFIHFNHTNPALDSQSPDYKEVINNGLGIAYEGMNINL